VRSAGEERGTLQSDRLKKQSLARRRRTIVGGLLVLLALIGGLYYLLSQYDGSVRNINFLPQALTEQPPSHPYEMAILRYLEARPTQRFRFALNNEELTQYLVRASPEVGSVTSNGGGIGYGDFIITMRQPTVKWNVGSHQYFVDSQGTTFEKNYGANPTVSVVDSSGAAVVHGSAIVSKDFLHFIGRLVALTDQSGLGKVTQVTLPANTTREVDLRLEGRGYVVKTHSDRDPAAEVEDMKRVIGYLDQRQLNPSYIDVRVVGRAFYK
jgi:hypothetical protein